MDCLQFSANLHTAQHSTGCLVGQISGTSIFQTNNNEYKISILVVYTVPAFQAHSCHQTEQHSDLNKFSSSSPMDLNPRKSKHSFSAD